MTMQKVLIGCVATLSILGGCSTAARERGARGPLGDSQPQRTWAEESARWRYPREAGSSVTNGDPGTLVLYQASTADSFADVLKYYETAGGVKGLSNPDASPGWVGDSTGASEKVVAVQAMEGFSKAPGDRAPNERSFLIRMPGTR